MDTGPPPAPATTARFISCPPRRTPISAHIRRLRETFVHEQNEAPSPIPCSGFAADRREPRPENRLGAETVLQFVTLLAACRKEPMKGQGIGAEILRSVSDRITS